LSARERLDNRVVLLERQSRVGRKLLATGNGRCNLSNTHAAPDRYHGADPAFVRPALARFGTEQTLAWFSRLGLLTRREDSGRIYPLSDAASSVVDVLRLAMDARGVKTVCGFAAAGATVENGMFTVVSDGGERISGDRLIVACGGMAGAKLGGTRDGCDLLASFGHRLTKLRPSLVQLKTDGSWTRSLKGIRTQAHVSLERDGAVLRSLRGEVQFAEYGLTGPVIFGLSRDAGELGPGTQVVLRLLPELSEVDITDYLHQKRNEFPDQKAEYLLAGCLHNSISRVLLRRLDIPFDARLWALSDRDLDGVAALLLRFSLPLQGPMGFQSAQVTAGGADTGGFDPETMESRLVPGLYACGEVLDIDGDCGGFNLQWAWSSGRMAGLSAAGAEP
ncbi:MAG: aminoacetone oxidase family FAD-binding enzyme, partial [Oscillospiraceae bacterium]|nr:aminoacetone oxidase family FAD-binding enzyme [Oscillospiraceae bacterium]